LLIIPDWRIRRIFIVGCIAFFILYALPVWDSAEQFLRLVANRLPTFLAEGTQRTGERSVLDIFTTNYLHLSNKIPLFKMGLWVVTGGAVVGWLFRRTAPETRILFASAATIWVGFLLILIRQHPHYLYGYCGVLALGLVTTAYLLGRLLEKGRHYRLYRHTVPVIVMLMLAFIGKEFAPSHQRQYDYRSSIVDGAVSLNALLEEKYPQFAHIHTPHTDSKAWAYYMGSFNSAHNHQEELAKHVPENVYFYRWDGRTFHDFLNHTYSMEDILGQYPGAVIYGAPFSNTRRSITGVENWYVEPEAVGLIIDKHSMYKRVAEVTRVPVSGVGQITTREGDVIWQSMGRQVSFSWKQQPGQPAHFDFTVTPWLRGLQISGYSFDPFSDKDARNMPESWRLLGSKDGSNWTLIDEQRGVKKWFPVRRRFYAIPTELGSPDPSSTTPPEGAGVISAETYVDLVKKLKSIPAEKRKGPNISSLKPGHGFNIFLVSGTYYAVPYIAGEIMDWSQKSLDAIPGIIRGLSMLETLGDIMTYSSFRELLDKATMAQFSYLEEQTIRFKSSPVPGYFVVAHEPYPHFFSVHDQPEFTRYRLIIEEGNSAKEIAVENLRFLVKADALYGKVNRNFPKSFHQFSDGQTLNKVSLDPFWEGSFLKSPYGLVQDIEIAGNPRAVTHYSILGPPKSHRAISHIPEDWNIEASNDGVDWVLVDSRSGQKNWGESETRTYTLEAPAAYRYFRLKFGEPSPAHTRVYGWSLFSSENTDPVDLYRHFPLRRE